MIETFVGGILAVIAAGGGIAAICFLIFKFLGEKWLTAKFDERLAAYRHAQQKESEQLCFTINALLDRTTTLHQREFEVVPEAWAKLNDTVSAVQALISPFQEYPDIDRMPEIALAEFLAASPLHGWEKQELLKAEKKNDYYIKRIYWHRVSDTRKTFRESHVYVKKNGIFMLEAMRKKFDEIDEMMWAALIEHEVNEEHDVRPREREKMRAFQKQGPELLKQLESEVQSRLWNRDA
jgi:hypothetical protein